MKGYRARSIAALVAMAIVSTVFTVALAQTDTSGKSNTPKVTVKQWLVLGPVAAPLPAFNDEDKDQKTGPSELLAYPHLAVDAISPRRGATVALAGGGKVTWAEVTADSNGASLEARPGEASFAYLAAWVDVPRWTRVDVEARSHHPVEVYVDGASVASQKKADKKDDAKASGSVKLIEGKHLLVVKSVDVPTDSLEGWRVGVTLSPGKGFDDAPAVSLDPERTMTIHDVLDTPMATGVDVSPDGEYVMIAFSSRRPPKGARDSWREIRRIKDNQVLHTLRDVDGSDYQWAPDSRHISYVAHEEKQATVRVFDLREATYSTVLEGVEHFGSYDWSPDGTYIVYSVSQEAEESKTGLKRMRGVGDRRAGERNRSYLYLASVPEGVTRRLTGGEYSARLVDIHPDARTLLVARNWEDLEAEPYAEDELVLLHLDDNRVDTLWTGRRLGWGTWSPDGKTILLTGGPSTFGDIGHNVPEGVTPNEYDTQAYLFDPATKHVTAITRDFDPAISSFFWPKGGDIYFTADAGEYNRLYRYNVKKGTFKEIETPCDVFRSSDVSRDGKVAVLTGSNVNRPWRVISVDLGNGKARTMVEPAKERFADVALGEVKDFDFTSSAGQKIVGRVYYPPGFTPEGSWPAIVYYYGGTVPVTRDFGGRYPKNLWAAHGYVVYVMQPSGATGFGQAFSAVHVNDWGKVTTDEVIEGTEAFLAAHSFVDPSRVGCIGASYGGFMTELLVTKTDIFAAAISHAGISDISSYWGEGYWGYQYNSVSAEGSFPWNRPDIYVDQSPLFHADKVTTPLLLLHGGADTNVPRGESDQMYAALKILGKEVEYIRVAGQNHWIVDYEKRIEWNNAIISWFDRWLKDQPQWWNDMYPPLDQSGDGKDTE